MKFLLLFAAVFALSLTGARADDNPPGAPPPAAPQNEKAGPGEKVTGRKEEEDEAAARASRIAKMAAVFQSKGGMADKIAALTARAEKAEKALAAAGKTVADLTAENDSLKADFAALEAAAETLGDGKAEDQQQSPAHQKAAAAINGQVARQLKSIGHDPKKPSEPAPAAAPTAKQPTAADLIKQGLAQLREKQQQKNN